MELMLAQVSGLVPEIWGFVGFGGFRRARGQHSEFWEKWSTVIEVSHLS